MFCSGNGTGVIMTRAFSNLERDYFIMRDETLRDGNQGEAPRTAAMGIRHIQQTQHWYDMMCLGWIYSSPVDEAMADYIRSHNDMMALAPKFWVYTLLQRSETLDPNSPFTRMLKDISAGTQPFHTVNVLSKARVEDLHYLGMDEDESIASLERTFRMIREANADMHMEIAMEHLLSSWIEGREEGSPNHAHIVRTLVRALEMGIDRITVPDTDGAVTPDQLGDILRELEAAIAGELQARYPDEETWPGFSARMFNIHTHEDLGMGGGNMMVAYQAGAGSFDCTVGPIGERRGNVQLAQAAATLGSREDIRCGFDKGQVQEMIRYQKDFEARLGVRQEEKVIGNEAAYVGTGGMHGARVMAAFDEFMKQDGSYQAMLAQMDYDAAFDWFARHYDQSYNTVPSGMMGQPLQMALSPVGGVSNVYFMLADMGLLLDLRKEHVEAARHKAQDVIETVKQEEQAFGTHYRGCNNVNAMLLVADRFGLRNPDATPLALNIVQDGNELGQFLTHSSNGTYPLTLGEGFNTPPLHVTLYHGQKDGTALYNLETIITGLQEWHYAPANIQGVIQITDCRVVPMETGAVIDMADGVHGEHPRYSVRAHFTMDGDKHVYLATGCGDNVLNATLDAASQIMNYTAFARGPQQLPGDVAISRHAARFGADQTPPIQQ